MAQTGSLLPGPHVKQEPTITQDAQRGAVQARLVSLSECPLDFEVSFSPHQE